MNKIQLYRNKSNEYLSIEFNENGYLVKNLDSYEEREAFYKLRYIVYSSELSWLNSYSEKIDSKNICKQDYRDFDEYDERSISFGLFHNNILIGGSRIILSDTLDDTMSFKTFNFNLDDRNIIKKHDKFLEISRMAISKEYRKKELNRLKANISFCLYKIMKYWILKNGFRYVYMVVEDGYFNNLQKFFEIKQCQSRKNNILIEVDFLNAQNKLKPDNYLMYKWFLEDLIE